MNELSPAAVKMVDVWAEIGNRSATIRRGGETATMAHSEMVNCRAEERQRNEEAEPATAATPTNSAAHKKEEEATHMDEHGMPKEGEITPTTGAAETLGLGRESHKAGTLAMASRRYCATRRR